MVKKRLIPKLSSLSSNDPMAMLLAKSGSTIKSFAVGEKVTATVVKVAGKSLVLDINAKAEGLVIDREFEIASPYIRMLKPGDKVLATVTVSQTPTGQVLFSLREQAQEKAWELFETAKKKKTDIEAKIEGSSRGGLSVSVMGIEGFIPTSHLSVHLSQNAQNSVGNTIWAKVIEIDQKNKKLVLSEKAVSEKDLIASQEKVLESIKKGDKFDGCVVSVVPFGAFVSVERENIRLEGLVHLSEISWEKTEEPSSVLKEGQDVSVIVIGREPGRLALSIRQTTPDPWTTKVEKFKPDSKVSAKVKKVDSSSATVELEGGIEGYIKKIPDGVSIVEGKKVDLIVEGLDLRKRRINLSVPVLTSKPVGYK